MAASACKYTILLLSAPLGSGHKMAAEALEEAFKKHGNVKVVNGSAFDFFPKWLGQHYFGRLHRHFKAHSKAVRYSVPLEQHRQQFFLAARFFKPAAFLSGAGVH